MNNAGLEKRTIVIGDVHGCLNELQGLLRKVSYDSETDRCIIVGDLVDRGPHSVDTVKFCKAHNIEVVLGNHDDKYVRYHEHQKKSQGSSDYKNPMHINENKTVIYNGLVETGLISWLGTLPTFINIPEINSVIVHAGINPSNLTSVAFHDRRSHLYSRFFQPQTKKMLSITEDHVQPQGSVHWTELYKGNETIIYGHHAHSLKDAHVVLHESNVRTIGIDTGCCFGGCLTALLIEPGSDRDFVGSFVSVPAKKEYAALR